jgi:lipid II isoglutaminyl synthase (glutamine-hydrolysing)
VPLSNSSKATAPPGGVGPADLMPPIDLPVRTRLAAAVGGGIGALSRATGRGSGSVVGGHAVLAIDPLALERLSAGRQVSLVSGTNGKTTTTKLLACALSSCGQDKVVTNLLGANLPTGLVASLAAGPPRVPAVLEVDEAWLARVAARARPSLLLLLNLSRDQLDRNNEVRQVAQRWRQACEDLSADATVVANADDPLVAWAAAGARQVTWVGAGLRWKSDASGCPACGGQVVFSSDQSADGPRPPTSAASPGASPVDQGWWCRSCGFSRPALDFWLGPEGSLSCAVLASGPSFPFDLALPGRCNQGNALMALAGAMALGADGPSALQAMASVRDVSGRYATLEVGAVSARLLLAKNPAGWAEVFDMLRPGPAPVVVAINARTADGRDPSWLWDVPFELLRSRRVVATGERGLDLAVRLHYAEVDHIREPDLVAALQAAGGAEVDVVANYTAFHQLLAQVGSSPGR